MLVERIEPDALADCSRHAFNLNVVQLSDGNSVTVPVNVLAGHGTRPRAVLVAGIHGNEADGIHALLDLWEEVDPRELTGRLVMVPVANPSAFRADRRRSALDDADLNRVFPGRPDGPVSERLAHRLFEQVLLGADFVFSMHGWGYTGDVVDYVEFNHHLPDTAPASYLACQRAGFEVVRISDWPSGLMTRVANEAGIPGMESEVGGLGIGRAEARERYKRYARALLRHLGMIEGAAPPAPPGHRLVESFELTSPVGGVLRVWVALGEEVAPGDLVATVQDFHGEVLAELHAPEAAMVGARREYASVAPGDRVVTMFRGVDESVIAGL